MALAIEKPSLIQSLLELRVPLEIASLVPSLPLLHRAPRGDGHPVLVFPGFMATDSGTYIMRRYLDHQGFTTYPWGLGRNPGLQEIVYRRLRKQLQKIHEKHGQTVSLVGWSLGGLYARTLAHHLPDCVRQVITLGSPFNLSHDSQKEDIAVSGPVMRLYERLNPRLNEDRLINGEPVWEYATPVPSTAIFSHHDGVASWQYCVDKQPGDRNENLRVPSSHTGMTHNPWVLYVLAERLAQPENRWRPFRNSWCHRLMLLHAESTATA